MPAPFGVLYCLLVSAVSIDPSLCAARLLAEKKKHAVQLWTLLLFPSAFRPPLVQVRSSCGHGAASVLFQLVCCSCLIRTRCHRGVFFSPPGVVLMAPGAMSFVHQLGRLVGEGRAPLGIWCGVIGPYIAPPLTTSLCQPEPIIRLPSDHMVGCCPT